MLRNRTLGGENQGFLFAVTSIVSGYLLDFSRSGSVSVTVAGGRCNFDLPGLQEPISCGWRGQLAASAGRLCLAKLRICANQLANILLAFFCLPVALG